MYFVDDVSTPLGTKALYPATVQTKIKILNIALIYDDTAPFEPT